MKVKIARGILCLAAVAFAALIVFAVLIGPLIEGMWQVPVVIGGCGLLAWALVTVAET